LIRVYLEEKVFSPRERLKCEVYLPIMNEISSALQHRFNPYKNIQNKFGFLSNFFELSSDDIHRAATKLMDACVNNFKNCFQCAHFCTR